MYLVWSNQVLFLFLTDVIQLTDKHWKQWMPKLKYGTNIRNKDLILCCQGWKTNTFFSIYASSIICFLFTDSCGGFFFSQALRPGIHLICDYTFGYSNNMSYNVHVLACTSGGLKVTLDGTSSPYVWFPCWAIKCLMISYHTCLSAVFPLSLWLSSWTASQNKNLCTHILNNCLE